MEEIMAEKENKTIIFVETKKRCDDITRRMRRDGWACVLSLAHHLWSRSPFRRSGGKKRAPLSLLVSLLGGPLCVFMGTRASQRETGCYQVQQWQQWALQKSYRDAFLYVGVCVRVCVCFPEFRSGKAPILIATDVASRGLGMFWVFKCYTITTLMQILDWLWCSNSNALAATEVRLSSPASIQCL